MNSPPPPCLGTDALRESGRGPATPFQVRRADGETLVFARLLRVLPGKRIVGEAIWRGRRVLAKLFVARHGARHWERERRGLTLLRGAGLRTPEIVDAGPLDGGGHYLLTAFLEPARTLADTWTDAQTPRPDDARSLAVLRRAFQLFGRLHAAGLIQADPHLGNFLEHAGELFLIDGDGVARMRGGPARQNRQALENLALLIAQLPPSWGAWDTGIAPLLSGYCPDPTPFSPERETLLAALRRARSKRLAHFLGKSLRDCSQFAVRHTARRFSSVVRAERETLAPLLDAPDALDAAIAAGARLKDGNTCTVARVDLGARPLLVKRYNLKNFAHALSRGWRPSRASHSWLAAHRLAFLGLPTPVPLALVEERIGPLRRRAFLVTEFCPGENLLQHFSPDREPDEAEARAVEALFGDLFRLRITHGDTKATNFLWHDGRLVLIDLDALVQHGSEILFARAWRRDRARFLRNWPEDSALRRWLDAHLPRETA